MTGQNIKVPGHAMKRPEPNDPYKWHCYCGAWARVLPQLGKTASQLRREGHDEHKINVLRAKGKLYSEEDDD